MEWKEKSHKELQSYNKHKDIDWNISIFNNSDFVKTED